jgi:hypothetical protein
VKAEITCEAAADELIGKGFGRVRKSEERGVRGGGDGGGSHRASEQREEGQGGRSAASAGQR